MNFWDIVRQVIGAIGSSGGSTPSVQPPPPGPSADQASAPASPQTPVAPPGPPPDRQGTFIIPDIYPDDLGPQPNFGVLPGLTVEGKEVVGCYLKVSEGTGWTGEQWFIQNWRRLRALTGPSFFAGGYHFLRFGIDGTRQADYFCDLIARAGGLGDWALMPWVDVEEGGQGSWTGGQKLANMTPAQKSAKAADVRRVTAQFIARVKQRLPGIRVGLYGRGIFRDLNMTDCHFGQDMVCNPAYTAHMVPMDQYGIHIDEIAEWQLCGDGEVYVPGYPHVLTGWGKTDYSVYIEGDKPTMLSGVRRRCLAYPR